MATTVLKWTIIVLILANVGVAGYNGFLMNERLGAEVEKEKAMNKVARIKVLRQEYKDLVAKIRRENIVAVPFVNVYLSEKAQACSMRPEVHLQIGTKSEKNRISGNFEEERWKILFNTKENFFSLRTVAAYCQAIETGSPQFQIKEVDLGKRSDIWGKDEWKPNSIVVRRVTLQSKKP